MTAASEIEVSVNDRKRSVAPGCSLQALMAELGFATRKGVAAAVNGAVVPKSVWAAQALQPADRIIVIQATQGG